MPAVPPGVDDRELEQLLFESNASVACTKSLLDTLISESLVMPIVTNYEIPSRGRMDAPEEDADLKKLRERLGHAGTILKKKRARTH